MGSIFMATPFDAIMHAIIYFSRLTECATLRMNHNRNSAEYCIGKGLHEGREHMGK